MLDGSHVNTLRADGLTLVSRRVLDIKRPDPLNEALHSALLEDSHQGRPQRLAGIRGHLGDCGLATCTLLDEAAGHLLKLQIASDIGRDKNVGELARRHEELGHEVNVPVVQAAVLLPWLGALGIVAVLLEQLQTCKVAALATE